MRAPFKVGKHSDADARRFLITASEKPPVEEIARLWIACVVGSPLPEGSLRAALRSGVLLCGLVNGLRRGIVPKVATDEQTASMAMESKRNAKMRENIGQYIDACAELGLSQREVGWGGVGWAEPAGGGMGRGGVGWAEPAGGGMGRGGVG